MITKEAIELLAKAEAITAASARLPEHQAALPSDFKIHDFESQMQVRVRMRGTMTTVALGDFAAYVIAKQMVGGSAVFVDSESMKATAVLNLGDPKNPGHCDHRAVFAPPKTAAFRALLEITSRNERIDQRLAAEFLEDWVEFVKFFDGDGEIPAARAIAAVRAITIDQGKTVETKVGQLSAEQGALERVAASSKTHPIPTFIHFRCQPNPALEERTFVLRLGISTGGPAPQLTLRVVRAEMHQEEMGHELAAKVRGALPDGKVPVIVGSWA